MPRPDTKGALELKGRVADGFFIFIPVTKFPTEALSMGISGWYLIEF